MKRSIFLKNRHFLLFVSIQAALWIIFFLIVYTGHRQDYSESLALLSSLRSILVHTSVIYIFYLWVIPNTEPNKRPVLLLILTALLITISASLNIYLETLIYEVDNIPLHLIGSSTTSLGLLFLSAPLKWSYNYFVLRHRQQEMLNKKMETELKYLRMQVNPHFLFNTLNNIYYLAEQKSGLAAPAISKLSELMRYLLEKTERETVSLEKEIDFIRAYIELEEMRISGLDIKLKIRGKVRHKNIPPMLILPLVENVFKHGIDKRTRINKLRIELNVNQRLQLIIENSLPKTNTFDTAESGSGITNLKKRLNLLFGDNFELYSGKTNQHNFKAKMDIPLS